MPVYCKSYPDAPSDTSRGHTDKAEARLSTTEKKTSDGVMFPNRPKRHYSQYALFIQGFAQIFQPGFSRQAGTGLLQSPM